MSEGKASPLETFRRGLPSDAHGAYASQSRSTTEPAIYSDQDLRRRIGNLDEALEFAKEVKRLISGLFRLTHVWLKKNQRPPIWMPPKAFCKVPALATIRSEIHGPAPRATEIVAQ
jgi:hypothetical protein